MKKGLIYLPTILLALIALNQIVLANFFNLSPWLGGGYGMFSTTDVGRNRHIHIYASSPGIKKELIYPDDLKDKVLRIKSFPTDRNLLELAQKIADIEDDRSLESIEIKVWKSQFETNSLKPSSYLLKSVRLEINQ